jgi:hypothetical protein
MIHKLKRLLRAFIIFCAVRHFALPVFAAPISVTSVKRDSDGITLHLNPGVMRLEVFRRASFA